MALGEEKAEGEASSEKKAPSCGGWSRREQELSPAGPVLGEQPPRLEAEGGPASPVGGTEGLPSPACYGGVGPGSSRTCQPLATGASREPAAGGSKPALSCTPPPASLETGDLPSAGSQMEEIRLPAPEAEALPRTRAIPRAAALCSGHDADIEDDPSPVESPHVPDLCPQSPISGFPCPSRWRSAVSPGTPAPLSSSCSVSASSPGSSLQGHQEKAEPRSGCLARVSSCLELAVPPSAPSAVGPGPRLQWLPQPVSSAGDAPGLGRRRLSFQAEYWACVLPDSLPPSPDRRSPLWNPNKEYEDLLDYTYPLRPGPRLPKQLDSHALAEPVLQDSGVDLDSFSISPASTLKSPTNVSHSRPPAEAAALPFSAPREPSLKLGPSGVPQKQGGVGLASCSPFASTPRAPGGRATPWVSREPARKNLRDWPPVGRHLELGAPHLRTRDRGWPSPGLEREKGASQGLGRLACTESGWKPQEEVESDDEYLALPTRLTQVSSLVSYLGSIPTSVPLSTDAAEGQSSLDVSDSDGPASLPSDSSQSQLPSRATFRGSWSAEDQKHRLLHSFVRARRSAGEGSLVSGQALGVSAGPMRTRASWSAMLDPDAEGQPPRKGGEQGKESLVQCVQQFKKDIDEHQSLTESVLQKGEVLLQSLLDNTPVLKDVLGRISRQPSALESHADCLYDTILASLDTLAGCTLTPNSTPAAHRSTSVKGISLASSLEEM
ncbi:centrosomal protein of 68 kDa isoform X2 [Muntiacus reevesi]|uniref:centrosomal protein of 68 kDa isoform X2 n=1 Tax=Muntiacus reevesi TaxID=9886 RepID=UPI003306D82F